MQTRYFTCIESPIGRLRLAGDAESLLRVDFQGTETVLGPPGEWKEDRVPFGAVIAQLGEYFQGRRESFGVPFALEGTPFQKQVWQALVTIPYGQTVPYGELARRIERPRAVRAVGAACGRNPIPVIIPCHRVIGSNGKLTGFRGGLAAKRRLLSLEAGSEMSFG